MKVYMIIGTISCLGNMTLSILDYDINGTIAWFCAFAFALKITVMHETTT